MRQDGWHVRLFGASTTMLGPRNRAWSDYNMVGPFWRLYCHDRPGAFLLLPPESNTSAASSPTGPEGWERYPLDADTVYLIPANVDFYGRVPEDVSHFFVHFDVVGIPRAAMRGPFHRPVRLPATGNLSAMVAALHGLHLFGRSSSSGLPEDERLIRELRFLALLHEALAFALLSFSPADRALCLNPSPEQEAVRPALEYIAAHLADRLPVSQLASLCFLSEDYFIRRFRECVGQTPTQYIQEQRIAAAAQRLAFTDDPIERIVGDTGFGSRHYFTRVFKEHTGHSPAAYRNARMG